MGEAHCNALMTDDERIALLWLRSGNGVKEVDVRPGRNERGPYAQEQGALVRALPGLQELGLVRVAPEQSFARKVTLTLEGERTAWLTTAPNGCKDG